MATMPAGTQQVVSPVQNEMEMIMVLEPSDDGVKWFFNDHRLSKRILIRANNDPGLKESVSSNPES